MYCLVLFSRPFGILILFMLIAASTASASVVRVETTETGNKLDLAEIEVTSGSALDFPNRIFLYSSLIPSTISDYLSVPENNTANTITVLGTPDAAAPAGNDRLGLLGDPHLNTGIFNPSASSPGIQVTFAEPLINGPGEEFVIFELTIGVGQTPDPLVVRQVGGVGTQRNVPSSHYQLQGIIPASGTPNTFLSTVENGGTTNFEELTTVPLTNPGLVTNPKWHVVPIDLDWLGVPAWQTVSSVEIVSGDASRAADLLMVMGLQPVTWSADYNRDLKVDDADYLIWQSQFGMTVDVTADGNGNGVVDAADYVIWRDQYGFGAGLSKVALPEPSGLWILGCAAPWLVARLFRR